MLTKLAAAYKAARAHKQKMEARLQELSSATPYNYSETRKFIRDFIITGDLAAAHAAERAAARNLLEYIQQAE